jgi:tetratricopeptide (TPR) repeat protein
VPTISLLAKLEDKNRLISVMLACGGACKDLAVDGVSVFSDDIDDLVKLLGLAEVYYINSELDIAKELYKKALEYSPYNEDALFHMAAILYAKGDVKEAKKFFAKYKVMFCNTFLPIGMFQKYFESGYIKTTPVIYPYLDANFVDEIAREVIEKIHTLGIDGQTLREIAEVISTCETESDCLILPLLPSILKKDKLKAVILYLLPNPAINNNIKEKLFEKLFDIGYQGRYIAFLNSKLVFATMVDLGKKSEFYQGIYRKLVLEMPFAIINLPLKCNVLKNVIVKVENVIPTFDAVDTKYITYMVLKNYAKACKILVEWEDVEQTLKIDMSYASTFMEKYGISKWIIR